MPISPRHAFRSPSLAALLEAAVLAMLATYLVTQIVSYPATEATDPGGYVSYLSDLASTGTFPPSRRLPGYSIFLGLASRATDGPLAESVFWVQFWLTLVFCLGVWAWSRRHLGRLAALCFLGIVAAPCYLAQMSAVMLPDALFGMLILPFLLSVGWWVSSAVPRGGWLWLPAFALALSALGAISLTAFVLFGLFLPALLLGLVVGRRRNGESRLASSRAALARTGALLGLLVLVLLANDRLLDTGARQYALDVAAYRVVMALPAATGSTVERRIDEEKERFSRFEGRTIEESRFGSYTRFLPDARFRRGDVRAAWTERLLAHPGQYLASIFDDLRLGHHLLARQLVPFFPDLVKNPLQVLPYPRDDGSPEGNLFRRSGLVTLERPVRAAHFELAVDATIALLQVIAVWGLVGLGVWCVWRRHGALALAFVTTFLAFALLLAATRTIDARYLLPFVVPIYLMQAVGIAWLVHQMSGAAISMRAAQKEWDDTEPSSAIRPRCRPSPSGLELAGVGLLLVILFVQLLQYPATPDPDPDGYVSHALRLLETGASPSSGRLPGYPLFLALIARLLPGPLAEAVYWVQLGLLVVFCLVLWACARRHLGPLTALCLLGIFAAPCYFTQVSVVMLPDVPYSILILPFLLGVARWTLSANPRGGWLWLPVLAVATLVLHAIRPTTFVFVVIFAPVLAVAWLVRRWTCADARLPSAPAVLARTGALVAVALLVVAFSDRYLDTGARRQNTEIVSYLVVTRLPSASDSPAEQRIEAAKARFPLVEGQRIEDVRFGTYERFNPAAEIAPDDAAAVWRDRLAAHPWRYLAAIAAEIGHDHHLVWRLAVPYFLDTEGYSLFTARYPRNDGSPAGDLFQKTGLIVLERPPYPYHFPLEVAVARVVAQLVCVWGLLGIGIWRLWPRYGGLVVAFALTLILFVVAIAAANTIDGRYLLPFAPLVYLGQAVGLAWIAQTLACSDRTEQHIGPHRSQRA